MKYRFEFGGYKCAGCGKDLGDLEPDDGCGRCGCITAEKKRIAIPIEETE